MRKRNLLLTLVALSLATSSLWAKPAVADENGKLPGVFMVDNQNGKKVFFSQAILQYCAAPTSGPTTHAVAGGGTAPGIWRFAENQYDVIGGKKPGSSKPGSYGNVYEGETKCSNWDRSSSYSGWIDAFCYGTSGYNGTLPYSATPTITTTILLTGENANYDWGVYNAISNGGNQPGLWRILTKSEWGVLLGTRTGASQLETSAVVNGVTGAILAPDGKTSLLSNIHNNAVADGQWTYLTVSEWEALEAQGAVFIPYGYWDESNGWGYWDKGAYVWHSDAGCARVNNSANHSIGYGGSNYGYTVRLVQDCPIPEFTAPEAKTLYYTGSSQELVTAAEVTGGTVQYKVDNYSWSTSIPSRINKGTYNVYYKFIGDATHNNTEVFGPIQVSIIDPPATLGTHPTAITPLKYNGSNQALVNPGSGVANGTLQYSLNGTSWGTSIPTGLLPGDYNVYYRVLANSGYSNFVPNPAYIVVNIAKGDLDVSGLSVIGNSLFANGSPQELVSVSGSVTGGTLKYSTDGISWSTDIPTESEVGTYTVYYMVEGDANHNDYTPVPAYITVSIEDYPYVADNEDPSSILEEFYAAGTAKDLRVKRTIYADDEYNTICLPFSLDESALAASPLAGFNRLKTFKGAQVTGTAPDLYIDIFVEDATTIEAGVPYLITYPSAHADIVNPVFNSITVTTTEPSAVSVDGITFQGMFAQVHIDPYDAGHTQDYLFVGANSQLYWPLSTQTSSDIKMRGFRAYFIIDRNSISPALAPKGTRARIMDAPKTTTAIDNPSAKFGGSEKIIENGILYIIRNGVKYNAQGQIVK